MLTRHALCRAFPLRRLPPRLLVPSSSPCASRPTRFVSTLGAPVNAAPLLTPVNRRRHATSGVTTHVVSSPYADVEIPDMGISEFVWRRIGEWADKTAVVCGISDRGYTYAELRDKCRRFAVTLQAAGYKPGDVIAVILPNTPDYPLVLLGALEAGLVTTTVNPAGTPYEISKQLVDVEPKIVVTMPENYAQVQEATRLAEEEGFKKPLFVVAQSAVSNAVPDGATSLEDMIGPDVDVNSFRPVKIDPASVAVIPYSSGTTGLPKGVCLTHRNLVANCTQMHPGDGTNLIRMTKGDMQEVIPVVLPFFHIYGINGVMIGKLFLGVKLVTLPRFEPETFLNTLAKYKASILLVVPPLVLFMGVSPAVTSDHLRHVVATMSAAAPLGDKDVERFLEKTPSDMSFGQAYGLTEVPVCIMAEKGGKKLGSVGKIIPNSQIKILCTETGRTLGHGQMGEICHKGPQNMVGYWKQPEATAEMIDKDGWLHTGDLGYYDEDGDFFIVDRLKELIKVKGYQVAPAELEAVLRSHPQLADAAVIGIPDAASGELPLAYVVARPTADLATLEEDVTSFVAGRLSAYKWLAGGVVIVKAIPKTASGKILRKTLKDEYKMSQEL